MKATECRCTDKTIGTGTRKSADKDCETATTVASCGVALATDFCSAPVSTTMGWTSGTDFTCKTMAATECRCNIGDAYNQVKTGTPNTQGLCTGTECDPPAAVPAATTAGSTTAAGEGEAAAAGEGEGAAAAATGAGSGESGGAIVALFLILVSLF